MDKSDYLKSLSNKLTARQIDRRQFMMSTLAAGVALPSALGLADSAMAATPKRGGRLRIGITGGATTDTLDPGQILDAYMINLQTGQVRNNLTVVGPDGSLQPELAESWEASADAKTWTLNIRKGVEFHNGKTLDSNDVVDSLNHHRGEGNKSAANGILSGISSVKADGKNTVVVELSGGDADFPFMLSDYHLNICASNGDGTIDWQSGNGTGGYILEENNPGVRSFTRRNPNYWKENTCF
jgi:peptide/nickel transport system substrate-binding protein